MDRKPTERAFGFVFAGACSAVSLLPLREGGEPRWWAAVLGGVFLLLAVAAPRVLRPLNRAWMQFGQSLSRITQPIFLAVLFYGVLTPFGWMLRLLGKNLLHLNWEPDAETYWTERGPETTTLRDQF